MILGVACLAGSGCGSHTEPIGPAPEQTSGQKAFAEVWNAATDTLDRYGFEIAYQDRRTGVIRTRPITGKHWFEFWRKDAASDFARKESTLQTIYRSAEVRIVPSDQEKDEFDVRVVAKAVRSSRPVIQVTSTSEAFDLFSYGNRMRTDWRSEDGEIQTIVPLGEDEALAEQLRQDILSRLGRTSQAEDQDES